MIIHQPLNLYCLRNIFFKFFYVFMVYISTEMLIFFLLPFSDVHFPLFFTLDVKFMKTLKKLVNNETLVGNWGDGSAELMRLTVDS